MSAGVDNFVVQELVQRGIRMPPSSGTTARPIAQSVIGGMLMLSRGFLTWGEAQRRKAWEPIRGADSPPDLGGQRMTVVGLGAIGFAVEPDDVVIRMPRCKSSWKTKLSTPALMTWIHFRFGAARTERKNERDDAGYTSSEKNA